MTGYVQPGNSRVLLGAVRVGCSPFPRLLEAGHTLTDLHVDIPIYGCRRKVVLCKNSSGMKERSSLICSYMSMGVI